MAPDFTLPSNAGKDISLKDLLKQAKHTVLYFYPGRFPLELVRVHSIPALMHQLSGLPLWPRNPINGTPSARDEDLLFGASAPPPCLVDALRRILASQVNGGVITLTFSIGLQKLTTAHAGHWKIKTSYATIVSSACFVRPG